MRKNLLFTSAITLAVAASAIFTNNANAQVTSGLVAKYSFNNGNANDEVGTNNGTVIGATLTTDRFGNPNKAYSFNGSSDYIIVPHTTAIDLDSMSNGISISVWVNAVDFPSNYASIVTKWCNASSEQYGLFLNSGGNNVVAVRSININGVSDSSSLAKNVWYHVVFTFDKTTLEHKVYTNAVSTLTYTPVSTYGYATDTTSLSFGAQACDVNGSAASPVRFFNGMIDDIRIYNRVLTTQEIQMLYNEADPTAPTALNDVVSDNNAITVYPNPTNGEIHLSAFSNAQLTTITGQVILTKKHTNILNLSAQPSGVYFLTLTDDNGKVLQRSKILKR